MDKIKKHILITGGSGYIGKSLVKGLNDYTVTTIGRTQFDLTSREDTTNWLQGKYFDVVIHTAIVGGSRLNQDDEKVFFQNLSMFYNLLSNQDHYGHLISIGSGAELGFPTDPYGLSKNIIHRIILSEPKLTNIRIFAVFDENELDRRFITPNIKRYINGQPIIIHQNKVMDFFYMKDLINLVKFIINNPHIKEIDCSYKEQYSLLEIGNMINELGAHKSKIEIQREGWSTPYHGHTCEIDIPLVGLKNAIREIYEKLN